MRTLEDLAVMILLYIVALGSGFKALVSDGMPKVIYSIVMVICIVSLWILIKKSKNKQ